jgi:hypothetical protein
MKRAFMSNCEVAVPETPKPIDLIGRQQLMIRQEEHNDTIEIHGADGTVLLSILVTERGPVLSFEGASLVLKTTGNLAIEAESLCLHGRAGASITSGGDLHVQAKGDIHSAAQSQTLVASLGDVRLRANDDVKMNGERIRMNC